MRFQDRPTRRYIVAEDVRFVDRERKKIKRKEAAKAKSLTMHNQKAKAKVQAARALLEFKSYLRRKSASAPRHAACVLLYQGLQTGMVMWC